MFLKNSELEKEMFDFEKLNTGCCSLGLKSADQRKEQVIDYLVILNLQGTLLLFHMAGMIRYPIYQVNDLVKALEELEGL